MSNGDYTIPPTDLTTTAIDAVNLILSQLGISPLDLLLSLFSGKPKFEDTDTVIAAYNMSAYWPLHALASDLQIAANNGAPISDSNPAVQAQFGVWKQGTVTSIQTFAGGQPGPSNPGYWTIFALIEQSWKASGDGLQAVLQYVKALDALTQVLAQQSGHPTPPPSPPPTPTPPPTPSSSLCDSDQPGQDEILDSCIATQTSLAAILGAIQALGAPNTTGTIDPCCAAVVAAIGNVVSQLANITALLSAPASPGTPIDLSGIVAAVQELVAAVAAYPPAMQACCAMVVPALNSIANALGPEMAANLKPLVDALNKLYSTIDVPLAVYQAFAAEGDLTGEDLQLLGLGEFGTGIMVHLRHFKHWLFGPLTPGAAQQTATAVKALLNGQPIPQTPANSAQDVLVGVLTIVGMIMGPIVGAVVSVAQPVIKDTINAITSGVALAAPGFTTSLPDGVGGPAVFALKYVQSAPAPGEVITTDNYQGIVQDAMGRAGIMGITAWGAAMFGGLILGPWEKYWGEVAAMIATAAGFDEIAERWMGPFLDAIIRNRAIQDANQKWPTRVPPGPQALALFARRKIPQAQADQLQGYAGLDPAWRPAMYLGAYRPVTPFVLASAFVDQPLDRNVILDILQDNAYSDSHANTMADAIVYKSIANVRNSYLSALISGYQKGVVGDAELDQALTDFNFSPRAKQYVTAHVLILRREVLAAETEKQIVPEIVNGLITPQAAQQQLELAGVQPWYAELIVGLAAVRAEIAVTKKEVKAEAKLLAKQQLAEQRTALAEFANGTIGAAALGATLIAAGLDPVVAAAVVAEKQATQIGRLKLLYGQLLTPSQAKLLNEQVGAIEKQLTERLITFEQALAQIKALGVDDHDANAIVAKTAAAIAAASTVGQLLSPLTGLPP